VAAMGKIIIFFQHLMDVEKDIELWLTYLPLREDRA
jgi:hypothetical protein